MSANYSVVTLADGREVCLSYGVPVAAFVPGHGYIKTAKRYSVTSSKHANVYTAGNGKVMDHEVFTRLVYPIEGGK